MKKIGLFLTAALFCIGTMTMMQSCSKPCKDDPCGANGACVEDGKDYTCTCETGYEGDLCDTEWRAEMLGIFSVSDVVTSTDNPGNAGTYAYESTVAAGATVDEITFSNFGGFGSTIKGVLSDTDSGTISSQTDQAGRKFAGTFSMSGSDIVVTYTVTYTDATTDDGVATFTLK